MAESRLEKLAGKVKSCARKNAGYAVCLGALGFAAYETLSGNLAQKWEYEQGIYAAHDKIFQEIDIESRDMKLDAIPNQVSRISLSYNPAPTISIKLNASPADNVGVGYNL